MGLDVISRIVWKQCFGLKKTETALVVTDAKSRTDPRYEISRSLWKTGSRLCKDCALILMKKTGMNGREPPACVAKAMLDYDAVAAPTAYSLTHTKATFNANRKGARVATMPGITEEMFLEAIPVDYKKMLLTIRKLEEKIRGNEFHIRTKAGTDLYLYRGSRKIDCDDGLIRKSCGLGNLPGGEVAFAPLEKKSEGVLVVDLSSFSGLAKRPFKVSIEKGHAVDCTDSKLWKAISSVKNGTNVAELGIGTNPKARITGEILGDEKVIGTAHIAFGTSKGLGGRIQTSIHLDNVFSRPTIEVDGRIIMKDGKA